MWIRKKMKPMLISRLHKPPIDIIHCVIFFVLALQPLKSAAQAPTTDPSEVAALNSVFRQWGATATALWNISGEPCSGSAVNGTLFDDPQNNPAIKCDCTYANRTTCHVTQLRVYALDKKGVIPKELTALSYLTYLKIDQNYFTGPLPSFIGNLSALKTLSVGINALSGSIPKELGNLKDLTLLAIGSNNFSGTLPPELGALVNLEELYMDSSGVGGEIPATFANLVNMKTVWASDTPLVGNIPDFIGNWTNMISLRFQGNGFEGPIPSTFNKLTSLTSLRIGDIYNVSSSLDFIKGMPNLNDLVLRNALISGNIPPDIGGFQRLQKLDLSFNNLTGQIPTALFNLSSLTYLFLGNNSLSGALPAQKGVQLQTIDLSYNKLSGSFPSWVNADLQLNLVSNDFTFDSSNISLLPGLNCLQRNFPCNRNTPRYANFAIKCGGEEMRPANGIVYEADNSTLGLASYNVTASEKWAVSNVGLYADSSNPVYTSNNLNQAVGTSTPELFQTSRQSPGSLRYYGLGLENGNYTVSLLFAETTYEDSSTQTWKSLGRRVFDIYIQGSLRQKDFDISKAAGGVERATVMNFNATVSQNYLEITLFWAGKGTCCIPTQGYYGPSISALSVTSDFKPSVSGIPPTTASSNNAKRGLIVGLTLAAAILCIILTLVGFCMRRKKLNAHEEELLGIGPKPNTFSYAELRSATQDFSLENKLGEGGFGPVYKGKLSDGRLVGIKQLSVASHQGENQFVTEIATISAVQHRNLVKLYGCCIEGHKRLLVYEYLENKSLDQALFAGKTGIHLDWTTRFSICLGTARGLAYLHEESRPRIVHRDVKASNILLDTKLCPKISDFGLAKLYDDNKTHISTRVAGTIGYLAPEYAMRGHLTEKADVFGFGVVALEVLCGRSNTDSTLDDEKIYLLEWAWNKHEKNRILELVDPNLTVFDEDQAACIVGVALLCTQASPMMRPSMSRVVGMLAGDIEVMTVKSKPSYLTDWDFKDITGNFTSEETTVSPSPASMSCADRLVREPEALPANLSTSGEGRSLEPIQSPLPDEPMIHEIIKEGR